MPPEALEGNKYSEKCDIYSFGIILYEIFSRCLPFSEYKQFCSQKELSEELEICSKCGESCQKSAECKTEKKTVTKMETVWNNGGMELKEAIVHKKLRPNFPVEFEEISNLANKAWSENPEERICASVIVDKIALLLGDKKELAKRKLGNNSRKSSSPTLDESDSSKFLIQSNPLIPEFQTMCKQMKMIDEHHLLVCGGNEFKVLDLKRKKCEEEKTRENNFGCDQFVYFKGKIWSSLREKDSQIRVWKGNNKKSWKVEKELKHSKPVKVMTSLTDTREKSRIVSVTSDDVLKYWRSTDLLLEDKSIGKEYGKISFVLRGPISLDTNFFEFFVASEKAILQVKVDEKKKKMEKVRIWDTFSPPTLLASFEQFLFAFFPQENKLKVLDTFSETPVSIKPIEMRQMTVMKTSESKGRIFVWCGGEKQLCVVQFTENQLQLVSSINTDATILDLLPVGEELAFASFSNMDILSLSFKH